MALNYTVTSSQIEAEAGTQVNLTTPSVTLTITANEGYTVTHTDFSIGDVLPSEVLSAVFSQNGDVVECLITFDNSFIMPSGDVDLPIDIDGTANLLEYSVSGTYDLTETNTTDTNATNIAYSGTGTFGQQVTLFTKTVTMDSGFKLVEPSYMRLVTTSTPNAAGYSITFVDTVSSGSIIARTYTVKYTFGLTNGTTDKIQLLTSSEAIYVPTTYIKSYIFDSKVLSYSATYRKIRIIGDPGALVTLNVFDGVATTNYATGDEIPASGWIDYFLFFPAVVADTNYTITISGTTLDPAFFLPNPITVLARTGTTITFDVAPLAGYTATLIEGRNTYSYPANTSPPVFDLAATGFYMRFEIEATDGSVIDLLREPLYTDFSNTNAATNGGTEVSIGEIIASGSGTTKIIIDVNATISYYGSANVDFDLDISELFNTVPVAVDDVSGVDKGSSVLVDVCANDTDADGQTLVPVILTQPSFGTAVVQDGKILYTHDGSTAVSDSLTYAASDGFQQSNAATLDLKIGLAPGDSINISGQTGAFIIPVIVGTGLGTFTAHFNAGSVADRIQLVYNGAVLADSLFVGDNLTDGNRATEVTNIEAITELDEWKYVGSGGNAVGVGQPGEAWDVSTLGQPYTFTEANHIAPTGNTRTDITSNYGAQVGVGNLVYTSISDATGVTGLDSADGNVSVSFEKTTVTPTFLEIKVYAPYTSDWSIYQTTFE